MNKFEEAKENFINGMLKIEEKNYLEAEHYLKISNQLMPERLSTMNNLCAVLIKLNKWKEAEEVINYAQDLFPNEYNIYLHKGTILENKGQFLEAINYYKKSIELKPDNSESYRLLGKAYELTRNLEEALRAYINAITFNESSENKNERNKLIKKINNNEDNKKKSIHLANKKEFKKAIKILCEVINSDQYDYIAFNILGGIYIEIEEYENALINLENAIKINPEYGNAFYNLSVLYRAKKNWHHALLNINKSINRCTDFLENAYNNKGQILYELHRYDEAIISLEKAISININNEQNYILIGNIYYYIKKYEQALMYYDKALLLGKGDAVILSNRANILSELERYDIAIDSFKKAIEFDNEYVLGYFNLANLYKKIKQYKLAVQNFEEAIKREPNLDYAQGQYLHSKMQICQWNKIEKNIKYIIGKINDNKKIVTCFGFLSIIDDLLIHYRTSKIWIEDKNPEQNILGSIKKHAKQNKIKIGYFSADFHNHATSYLIAELFEKHNKSKFEIIGFSFGPDLKDEMQNRICRSFDKFIDVRYKSDKEIAELSRNLKIDIAIDLKGLTENGRLGIFSYRAAPIQVNYLGYPGTLVASYMDYLIADKILIPQRFQQFYKEKIVYMPQSYQINDSKRKISKKKFTKKELGLPEKGFIFCCFNNSFKITPEVFESWVRILKKTEGSVLWLLEDNESAVENLKNEAKIRNLDTNRIVFAKRMEVSEHLSRQSLADLFLDTFPYNAHTTASDALWASLPIITLIGETFASRVGASLLTALGLEELITTSLSNYEELAIKLANNNCSLNKIRNKLKNNKSSSTLFDACTFAKTLEEAYIQMFERYELDLKPDNIYIS